MTEAPHAMTNGRILLVVGLAMVAFASNSVLCRLALTSTQIDPASFTSLRLISGSVMLWLLLYRRPRTQVVAGSWLSAGALFAYAAGFSYAYRGLSAGTGSLLLFGAVQASMIGYGMIRGERFQRWQIVGFATATTGLVVLVLPSVTTPPLTNSLLMIGAGLAWAVYSIRGRTAGDPALATAGNFHRCVPLTLVLSALMLPSWSIDAPGALLAVLSGTVASGIGYVVWYTALKEVRVTQAATAQLSVPVLSALGGVLLLGESLTLRLCIAAVLILGGIAGAMYASQRDRA